MTEANINFIPKSRISAFVAYSAFVKREYSNKIVTLSVLWRFEERHIILPLSITVLFSYTYYKSTFFSKSYQC